ncbi:discoidin domain-containing protein [Fulvivirga sp. M361]|uniref:discoidin domain-containing protein n=1 Tax=Fulvivirga sp. M361 TaxID=2594266 RepID=UPI001629F03E|nr:discoidin domain-containing protein [Fulvivirga sp. M361]
MIIDSGKILNRVVCNTFILIMLFNALILPAQNVIENSFIWKDTDGNTIEAHGSGFIYRDGTYYMIGEDKSHNAHLFKGVNLYSSPDLMTWTFVKTIIDKNTHTDLNNNDRVIERPKILYNDQTRQYVVWLHYESGNYGMAQAGVFYSDQIDGDYIQHSHFRPFGKMARDCTLFKDDDGMAYFIAAANENADIEIYRLTADYLDVEANIRTLWPGRWREAPAMFKHNGYYFLVTSGATGWDPNQGKYAYAQSIEGPWSDLMDLGNGSTFDSQPNYIIPVVGTEKTTFIYSGDRWQDPDLQRSKYIWLPLQISGNKLTLNYRLRWQIDVNTGNWNDYTDPQAIDKRQWTLEYVSSEEAFDGSMAENVYDNDPLTFWHSDWKDHWPSHPHQFQIDLGANYTIEKLRLLPRQDGNSNGMVKRYDLYISKQPENWGNPVSSNNFTLSRSEKEVTISPKEGRYIRFDALSGFDENPWSSLAELDVIVSPGSMCYYSDEVLTGSLISSVIDENVTGKAFDGSVGTYFEAGTADGHWIGYDLGAKNKISALRFHPRAHESDKMIGGKFQASNSAGFDEATGLYTIDHISGDDWQCISTDILKEYRYVRYLSPDNSYGTVAEIEFYKAPSVVLSIDPENVRDVLFFPNPVKGELSFKDQGMTLMNNSNVEILDASGTSVGFYENHAMDTSIDVRHLSTGVYMVRIQSSTGLRIRKLIKQ